MGIEIVLIVVLILLVLFFMHRNSELSAKISIILNNSAIDWSQYYTGEIVDLINGGKKSKAAMKLRAKIGLSFNECLDIIEHTDIQPNA